MKVAIVGAGKLGVSLAETFMSGRNEVTVIDKDEELLERISSRLDIMTVIGNAKRSDILNDIGIKDYDIFIAATDYDERNMVICAFAKYLGCPCVIARVRSAQHVVQIPFVERSLGIDYVVNPDMSCAQEIFNYLTQRNTFEDDTFLVDGYDLLELPIEQMPDLIDKKIQDLQTLPEKLVIVAVSRDGKIIVPNGSTELAEGDLLYIMGEKDRIGRIRSRKPISASRTEIKKVMIAGGGKTGYFLSYLLSKQGIAVKVIEIDSSRCKDISEKLDNVLVLKGDATDINLLTEENIESMDAFVAVTGLDEENLLLSLVAKNAGVPEVISKVSRKSYASITDQLGASMIINPIEMCVSDILRYVQRDKMPVLSRMIQGQAEIVRVEAKEGMKLVGPSLAEINMPHGMLIVALRRGADFIIPSGSTNIEDGDIVLILSLLSTLPKLEELTSLS